jgi:hypothetical protein
LQSKGNLMVPWLAASSLAILADLVVTLYLMLHPEVTEKN